VQHEYSFRRFQFKSKEKKIFKQITANESLREIFNNKGFRVVNFAAQK